MRSIKISIRGMHCRSCEILICEKLEALPGVRKVAVDYRSKTAELFYKGQKPSMDAILSSVREAGYEVGETENAPWLSADAADYRNFMAAAAVIAVLYVAARQTGLFDLGLDIAKNGLFTGFLIGLAAGVSTCMALVGGLVLGLSARHAEIHPEATIMQKFRPHLFFNLGRIVGFAILGGIIGLIGSALTPSARFMGLLAAFVGLIMISLGLKLVGIFPRLQAIVVTLPAGIARKLGLHKDQREYSHAWAVLAGALTFFLPCGFTQAMQLYAVGTGSFLQGALVMSLFAVGTAPGLLGIGGFSSIFKGGRAKVFFAAAGLAIIIMGWINISNGGRVAFTFVQKREQINAAKDIGDFQEIRMVQYRNGYEPSTLYARAGKPVRWVIDSKTQFSCASSIVVPSLGISRFLQEGENVVEFTPLAGAREIPFSCSMGMYRGKFIITD